MSNQTVGAVYAQIIADVIDSSRVDFEEMGVEESVLEDLKKGWQRKLTQLSVAQFPWDPRPDPPAAQPAATQAAPQPPAAAPSYTQPPVNPAQDTQQGLSFPGGHLQQNDNGNSPQIKSEPGFAMNEPMIKQEPGAVNNGFSGQHPGFSASIAPNNMVARERAAQQLQSKFGQQATASINALQNGTAQGGQLNQTQHQGQPQAYTQTQSQAQAQAHAHAQAQAQAQAQQAQRAGQPQQQQQLTPQQQQQYNAQYQRHLAAQQAQQQQQRAQQAAQANGQNGANPSQMDGSSEAYDGVLVGRDADGNPVEMGRLEIDSLLHEQIASRAKQMEGGGLMLPLKEATKHRSVAKKSKRADGPSQLDGFDDDGVKEEEVDEDAINSDLDDPDDDQEDDDEDDDSMGHIMLCMYDKVQRVKNKWKCTLKDGVLTVNGKEYVFHKATGEYEW